MNLQTDSFLPTPIKEALRTGPSEDLLPLVKLLGPHDASVAATPCRGTWEGAFLTDVRGTQSDALLGSGAHTRGEIIYE